jgi:putative metallohydrolase (TIGR04338 family)
MTTRPRDSQRQRLYDAENLAFGERHRGYIGETVKRYIGTLPKGESVSSLVRQLKAKGKRIRVTGGYRGINQTDGTVRWYKLRTRKRYHADSLPNLEDCQLYIDLVLSQEWWPERSLGLQEAPYGGPMVARTGKGARWATARKPEGEWGRSIVLPLWARSKSVILHEMAHHLITDDLPAHGPEYAATFLYLVLKGLGREDASSLAEAYKAKGVTVDLETFRNLAEKGA